jgi:hypothetical protein
VVSTLEEVKRHPLLKQIVDWRFAETGRLKVQSIDGGVAFCEVLEEQPERQIGRFQKIVEVIPAPAPKEQSALPGLTASISEEPPRLGWVEGGLWLGGYSRDAS